MVLTVSVSILPKSDCLCGLGGRGSSFALFSDESSPQTALNLTNGLQRVSPSLAPLLCMRLLAKALQGDVCSDGCSNGSVC